jgi:polyferredoxin
MFVTIGALVAIFRENNWYFLMFATIGVIHMISVMLTDRCPRLRQTIRLIQLSALGIFLFAGLSLRLNVNFQFPQVIFDAAAGIVSGALVQLLIARVVIPLIFGNAFCSRACWDAMVFELADQGRKRGKGRSWKERSEFLAWGYFVALIVLAVIVSHWHNPVYDDTARRYWLIGENLWIVVFGLGLTKLLGSRAYCRLLCPFLTLSGLFSRFSIFKITPVNPDACNGCSLCNSSCPMMVNVMEAVRERSRVQNRQCILCERCVDACPNGCLKIAAGNPLR